jgi:hypothetical protein
VKGHPRYGGRKKGGAAAVSNKRTLTTPVARRACEVLEAAVHEVGGVERLVAWVKESKENEFEFWSQMYMRLVPAKLRADAEVTVKHAFEPGELEKALSDRGLPRDIFGADMLLLTDETTGAEVIEGATEARADTAETAAEETPAPDNVTPLRRGYSQNQWVTVC